MIALLALVCASVALVARFGGLLTLAPLWDLFVLAVWFGGWLVTLQNIQTSKETEE